MFLGRETFGLHILDVIGESLLHLVVEISIFLDELGGEAFEQAKQVMQKWRRDTLRPRVPRNNGSSFERWGTGRLPRRVSS